MFNMQKIAPSTYLIPKEGKMLVDGLVIASEELLSCEDMKEPLLQVKNVATLPGIVGHSIAMPDIHWGYGFPIGGVAAMDLTSGVISPGGVGYDINCGVRLATAPAQFSDLGRSTQEKLLEAIYRLVPSGVGYGHKGEKLSEDDYKAVAEKGALLAIEKGYGFPADLERIESRGLLEGADIDAVSLTAKKRGQDQLGTLGSGNHFIEIGSIEQIFLPDIAEAWNIHKGQIYILIHSGSRGFGHQICQDTITGFLKKGFGKDLSDQQLIAAPINSPEGRQYFSAMAAAANYAFCNRQRILHDVRRAFAEICHYPHEQIELLYDVCHNIAKIEEHTVNGHMQNLLVHRKGATRAFGKGNKELAERFQKTGQPVLVPGDMGRCSYLMAGLGNELTFSSSCHGAGRLKSRMRSTKDWKNKDPLASMEKLGIMVKAHSLKTIVEEMPDAYKDVSLVVQATENAKLAQIVAKLQPRLVIKG